MSKPGIWWSGIPTDGIYNVFKGSLQERGYNPEGNDSAIVAFSAGDPFWADHPHDRDMIKKVAKDLRRKVMIFERHEYGWCNYTPELRRQNAWLGVPEYGRDTEVSGGKHAEKHRFFHDFVQTLVAQIPLGRKLIYLRREYFADFPYPSYVHPESFHVQCVPQPPSFEQWMARPFDVICVWGETHPHRKIIAEALREAAGRGLFRAEIRSPVYGGQPGRLPDGDAYRQFHEQGRIFIESDGHGLGGGRSWELITTLAMARKRSHMVVRNDWVGDHSCLEFGTPDDPRPEELIQTICEWLAKPEELYRLFRRGHGLAGALHNYGAQGSYLEMLMGKHGFFD